MLPTRHILLLSLVCILLACKNEPQFKTIQGNELIAVGRSLPDSTGYLELISSASHTTFGFEGNECVIYLGCGDESSHSYIQWEVDGSYAGRQRINGLSDSLVIQNEGGTYKTVNLYKATEAHSGPLFIQSIKAKNIQTTLPENQFLIEFIGNSITCGAAADTSLVKCGEGVYHDQHNAYMAYGPRTARSLSADFVLSSVSGYGIYRTWNMESPDLPQVYEVADFVPGGSRMWDFSKTKPDLICIALGTNDLSGGDKINPRTPFDADLFTERYISFIKTIKKHHAGARLVLLDSPMIQGERASVLNDCLVRVKNDIDAAYPGDSPIVLFQFTSFNAGGCTGHPSVADHEKMAKNLTPFLSQIKGSIQKNK